jgi:hypothetical protein
VKAFDMAAVKSCHLKNLDVQYLVKLLTTQVFSELTNFYPDPGDPGDGGSDALLSAATIWIIF